MRNRANMSSVEVTVKSQKGDCRFGFKPGDKIVFDGRTVKGNTCYAALMVLMPYVYAMRYGIEFPWAKDKDTITVPCPDAENPVVFEIRRLKK